MFEGWDRCYWSQNKKYTYSLMSCKCWLKCSNFMVYLQVTIVTDSQSQGSQPNVPTALKNFSLSQKEKTLHELVRDQWLDLTTDGVIRLGLKSFLDLRSWFRNNDLPSCHVCNEAGIKVVPVALWQSILKLLIDLIWRLTNWVVFLKLYTQQ